MKSKKNKRMWDGLDRRLKICMAYLAYYCDLTPTECESLNAGLEGLMVGGTPVQKNAMIHCLYHYAIEINWLMRDQMAFIVQDIVPFQTKNPNKTYNHYCKKVESILHHTLAKHNHKYRKVTD